MTEDETTRVYCHNSSLVGVTEKLRPPGCLCPMSGVYVCTYITHVSLCVCGFCPFPELLTMSLFQTPATVIVEGDAI